jgi:hypothetical protein
MSCSNFVPRSEFVGSFRSASITSWIDPMLVLAPLFQAVAPAGQPEPERSLRLGRQQRRRGGEQVPDQRLADFS